jgi:hypothetical protein
VQKNPVGIVLDVVEKILSRLIQKEFLAELLEENIVWCVVLGMMTLGVCGNT